MIRKLGAIAIVAPHLASCNNSKSGGNATPGATPSSRAQAPVALAFLGWHKPHGPSDVGMPDEVKIVGLDGTVKATANFAPAPLPFFAEFDSIVPPAAIVAAGSVYYADKTGVVRRLDPNGSSSTIAQFPVRSSQSQLSFAISPDAKTIAGIVYTAPEKNPAYKQPGDPPFAKGAKATWTVYRGDVGGTLAPVREQSFSGDAVTTTDRIVGWDATSPIVAVGGVTFASDAMGSESVFRATKLVRLEQDGSYGPPVGGASCTPWSVNANGTVVCIASPSDPVTMDVRDPAGSSLFKVRTDFAHAELGPKLSPLGDKVSASTEAWTKDGAAIKLNPQFCPMGWFDESTLVGATCTGDTPIIQLLSLSSPAKPRQLPGLSLELYVGPVSA